MNKMKNIMQISVLVFTAGFLLTGCLGIGSSKKSVYRGTKYTKTTKVIPSFQPEQVPVSCVVFSHLLVQLPANLNGKTIAQAIAKEAGNRGADMLLIGGSRQAEDDEGLEFTYYGPEQPYNCRDHWNGWKFGYDTWADQGDWVTLGYKEWGNAEISYNFPIVTQAAFLRCRQ